MNEIKRWSPNDGNKSYMIPLGDGDYVIYSDHKQALAQKGAECADHVNTINGLMADIDLMVKNLNGYADCQKENAELQKRVKELEIGCEIGSASFERMRVQNADLTRQLAEAKNKIAEFIDTEDRGDQDTWRKRAERAEAQLEEARKVLEPIKNVHSTYSDENKRHNTFAFMEDAWNTIKQAALAGKGNENKQNIDKPYCPKCQGTGWIVLDGSACPYCNPDGSWRSIFKGKKL